VLAKLKAAAFLWNTLDAGVTDEDYLELACLFVFFAIMLGLVIYQVMTVGFSRGHSEWIQWKP